MEPNDGNGLSKFCSSCHLNEANSRKRLWISCSACASQFHCSCINLTRAQADALPGWRCSDCRQGDNVGSDPSSVRGPHIDTDGPDAAKFFEDPNIMSLGSVRVLKRIPKGARNVAASLLSEIFHDCAHKNDLTAWRRQVSFASQCFRIPDSTNSNRTLTASVKDQIAIFRESLDYGLPSSLNREDTVAVGGNNGALISLDEEDEKLGRRVSAKLADGDVRGAVRLLSSDTGIAPNCQETLNKLKERHPRSPPDIRLINPPDPDTESCLVATPEMVLKAVNTFPAGSAGGPDGLRPQHIKDLLAFSSGDARHKLLGSLTDLINLVLGGNVNLNVIPFVFGANLTALSKKNGDVRPIAVGNTIRRIAGKICSKSIQELLGNMLQPIQLGFGTKGGCEAAVHVVRDFIYSQTALRVIFKADFSNAFNTIRRDALMEKVKLYVPSVYGYVYQAYASETSLMYNGNIVHSATGVQQGDPMGPPLFALGVHSLAQEMKSPLNAWYLDDVVCGGSPEVVLRDFKLLVDHSDELGLRLNQGKSELIIINPNDEDEAPVISMFRSYAPSLEVTSLSEAVLLGSPLSESSVMPALSLKREALERLTDRLKFLNPHEAFFILKNCLSIPKFAYLLRTSPCWKFTTCLEEIDKLIQLSLQNILNVSLSDNSLIQASLPVSSGGLGVRSLVAVSLPSYLASFYSTEDIGRQLLPSYPGKHSLENIEEARARWSDLTQPDTPFPSVLTSQHSWDVPLIKRTFSNLLNGSVDLESRARLLGAAAEYSGAWLNAIPCAPIGTRLDGDAVRIAVGLRLGANLCIPFSCICGAEVDESGRHGLSCKKSLGRHPRHEELNSIVSRSLTSAGFTSILEPPGISRSDGKRPDGITLFPWRRGICMAWDATCVDTLAPSNVGLSAVGGGDAASRAERLKVEKYSELRDRIIFIPLGFETVGGWGTECKVFVNKLGSLVMEKTGEKRSKVFLVQRLSIAIQRGNAAGILGSAPRSNPLDELFRIP